MCGITGYKGKGDESILKRMNDSMSHRGPDDGGQNIFGDVGLAQRRLSIIDTSSAGHQPMSNEDGTIWIVFNGEIYNYVEIKRLLKKKHSFKSQTDTEIIIHLYEEIGTEVFSKIHGMFAIVLFDSRNGNLILARDRMGKKPLYWGIHGKDFLFGSELKALMEHPSFVKELDLSSVNKYLLYENVPTPHTMFKNTWKLEPGTFMVWDGRKAQKKVFWKTTFLPKESSFDDSLRSLDDVLGKSVKDRLVADVPLGIFLSGGLDSSTIAYYASKFHKGSVKTFSIGFKEASFDESAYARKVSAFLGTEHYEKILSVQDCMDIIVDIGEKLDEPMADASIVPTYLLSKFARENVTVAVGGDGGDELFCGYDTFLAHRLSRLYEILPKALRHRIIAPIMLNLPTSYKNMSLDFRIKKFISGFEGDRAYRNQRWLGAFDREGRKLLFLPEIYSRFDKENEFDDIDRYVADADSKDFFDELCLLYERMYMMDQVLVKVDRASMMNSLEVRAPFLDTRVVDLANHMPSSFKIKGLERKHILKKLMSYKLPKDIVYRKKKGFGMPIGEWISGGLKSKVEDFLGEGSISRMGLFDHKTVRALLDEHYSGKKDNRKQIWTLFVFSMWWRNYFSKV